MWAEGDEYRANMATTNHRATSHGDTTERRSSKTVRFVQAIFT